TALQIYNKKIMVKFQVINFSFWFFSITLWLHKKMWSIESRHQGLSKILKSLYDDAPQGGISYGRDKNTCISPYFLRIDNAYMMRNALHGE
ncbi:MAG: hypothetical protein PHW49_03705, partial [Acinetobacter harbinensis]|nr:hypothetical protein [Acinetobacter harbinensis]